jgi:hypothetical protein
MGGATASDRESRAFYDVAFRGNECKEVFQSGRGREFGRFTSKVHHPVRR